LAGPGESKPFIAGLSGIEWWAFCRYDLGLSEQESANLRWAEFQALETRWAERQKRDDYRAGIVAATLANIYLKRGAAPFGPGDFFPSLKEPEPELTEEQQIESFKALMAGWPGATIEDAGSN
jgi:hypothetical protein